MFIEQRIFKTRSQNITSCQNLSDFYVSIRLEQPLFFHIECRYISTIILIKKLLINPLGIKTELDYLAITSKGL